MSKIYTETHKEKFICECMGKPCDYYDKCEYPPIYCDSHSENGMEVREYIKGMRDSGGIVTFKNYCRRDDEIIKMKWNEQSLRGYMSAVVEKFPDLQCNFDVLKAELQDLGIWEERA